jgi:hypothetical protein
LWLVLIYHLFCNRRAASEGIYEVGEEVMVPDDPEFDAYEDLEKEIMCAQTDDMMGQLT